MSNFSHNGKKKMTPYAEVLIVIGGIIVVSLLCFGLALLVSWFI